MQEEVLQVFAEDEQFWWRGKCMLAEKCWKYLRIALDSRGTNSQQILFIPMFPHI